jgi:hypothetical protein
MPKIQRLITPITLQRKRRRIALKNKRRQKRREESAIYHQTLTKFAKVFTYFFSAKKLCKFFLIKISVYKIFGLERVRTRNPSKMLK